MSRKSRNPGPVPAANRKHAGTDYEPPEQDESDKTDVPKSESGQDPQRRDDDLPDTEEFTPYQLNPQVEQRS